MITSKKQLTIGEQKLLDYVCRPENESMRTISTKLVNDPLSSSMANNDKKKKVQYHKLPYDTVMKLSQQISTDIIDIRNIKKSLPEVDTVKDIVVSSILSPNDMLTEELIWTMDGRFPAKLGSDMMNVIKTHFETELRFNEKLSTMLGNALFDRGSHILAIFPESAIDDIINSRTNTSLESYQSTMSSLVNRDGRLISKGFLGGGLIDKQNNKKEDIVSRVASLESFYGIEGHNNQSVVYNDIIPGLLRVSDNTDIIKFPMLNKVATQIAVNNRNMNHSLESIGFNPENEDLTPDQTDVGVLYRDVDRRSYNGIAVINDRTGTTRRSIGHPMVLDLPHESCIPVYNPSDCTDHLGYFVVLDELGNPISVKESDYDLSTMGHLNNDPNNQVMQQNRGVVTQTIDELAKLTTGVDLNTGNMNLDELLKFYSQMIERDLIARFSNGIYGSNIEIARPMYIYWMMLSRALSGSMTQLLYIPATLVEYIAFNYDEFGIGKSIIAMNKTQAALRISIIFANTMAAIKNAVGRKTINITLDPDDQNEDETISKLINRVLEVNSFSTLFHSFDPRNIEQALHRHGWDVNVDGGEGFEQTKVEVEYNQGNRTEVDTDFADTNKRDFIAGLQIPPSILDSTEQETFAVEFIKKHAIHAKRSLIRANKFGEFCTSFVRKYTMHDGTLIRELSDLIRAQYQILDEELIDAAKKENSTIPIINEFLNELYVGLSLPDGESNENINNSFKEYSDLVDNFIPVMLDRNIIEKFVGEDDPEKKKEAINNIEDIFKNLFKSAWIRQNGVFNEFDEMFFHEGKLNSEKIASLLNDKELVANLLGDIVQAYYDKHNPEEGDDSASQDSGGDSPGMSGSDDSFGNDDNDDSNDESEEEEPTEEEEQPEEDTEEEPEKESDESKEEDNKEDKSDDDAGDQPEESADATEGLSLDGEE